MKISHLESVVLGNLHFVRVHTDTGLTGVGQSACWAYPEAVDAVVASFRAYLVGADPLKIEDNWHQMFRMGPFRSAVITAAISAIDIALWDLFGKVTGQPVWQLLGGQCRDRLRLMRLIVGPDDPVTITAAVRQAVDDGYTAIKFDPLPGNYADLSLIALVQLVIQNVKAARDIAGSEVDLVLEFHRSLTPLQIKPVLDAVAQFRPLFVEDPIQIDSIAAQGEIARSAPCPVALGERLNSLWEFSEQIASGGPIYLRADVGLAGGISHCRKILALAEAHHLTPVWHNWQGPVITAATAHLCLAAPNFLVLEYFPEAEEGEGGRGFISGFRREGGYLLPSAEPGLGVDFDPAAITRTSILGRPVHAIPRRRDGSVAFAV